MDGDFFETFYLNSSPNISLVNWGKVGPDVNEIIEDIVHYRHSATWENKRCVVMSIKPWFNKGESERYCYSIKKNMFLQY